MDNLFLRSHREAKKLSVADIAAKLCIKPEEYSELESGEEFPSFEQVVALSKLLGIDQHFLRHACQTLAVNNCQSQLITHLKYDLNQCQAEYAKLMATTNRRKVVSTKVKKTACQNPKPSNKKKSLIKQ